MTDRDPRGSEDPRPAPDAVATPGSYGSVQGHGPSAAAGEPEPATKTAPPRALDPDLLRGLLMVLMALDHTGLLLNSFVHGTSPSGEAGASPVRSFNLAFPYALRSLSHLCASGFAFLMGMGVVFLVRARSGWPARRLVRHLAVRAAVLGVLIPVVMGVAAFQGSLVYVNVVMLALAFGYLADGLLCLAVMRWSEEALARLLVRGWGGRAAADEDEGEDEDQTVEPLLRRADPVKRTVSRARSTSWHLHNAGLLAVSVVAVWCNMWFAEGGGRCRDETSLDEHAGRASAWLRVWIWPVTNDYVVSLFPPLAWISFCLLGLLYGRILTARPWTRAALSAGYAFAAVAFAAVFVATRVLQFGNLSEGCMQAPEHLARPAGSDPYLASPASFFYVVKYPPDVAFWAYTMAGNLVLLAAFAAVPRRVVQRATLLLDLGRSALLFYFVHIFLIVLIKAVLFPVLAEEVDGEDPLQPGDKALGIRSWPVYWAASAVVVLTTWPLCRWYARFKAGRAPDSIWRLF